MHRLAYALLPLFAAALAPAQEVRRGKVKKVDADRLTVTISEAGRDRTFHLTDETRFLGVPGDDAPARLRAIKKGAEVMFKPGRKGGRDVLLGIKPVGARPAGRIPRVDTSKLRPLTELGAAEYRGFPGGLYPGGKNERPAGHETLGLSLAKKVRPLDASGRPDPGGKIVLLSVGMSNTSQESDGFRRLLAAAPPNPRLAFVNGAQGGMTARAIQDPDDGRSGTKYWREVDRRLKRAGLTREQVQVVWVKQADAAPAGGFPAHARDLQAELEKIVRVLHRRFPNVKLAYLSSRIYAGYATTRLNPEPYAYESGFAVKWLIEKQLRGDPELNCDPARGPVKAPWLSWGPYLWANGPAGNAAGLSYREEDFAVDGTHPSASGVKKVAGALLRFFETDTTCRPWFTRP